MFVFTLEKMLDHESNFEYKSKDFKRDNTNNLILCQFAVVYVTELGNKTSKFFVTNVHIGQICVQKVNTWGRHVSQSE